MLIREESLKKNQCFLGGKNLRRKVSVFLSRLKTRHGSDFPLHSTHE